MKIAISGMISSGKSTLVNHLASHFQKIAPSDFLKEFKEDDEIFNNLLKWHLEHIPNVTLAFETYVLDSHISELEIKEANLKSKYKQYYIFLDRFSVEHIIFSKIAFDTNSRQWKAYQKIANSLINASNIPDFVIFLDLDFETFKKRIFARNREVEIANWETNEAYYKKLHSNYKDNFISLCNQYQVRYEIIDTNELNEEEVLKKAIALINAFELKK
ncbi:deoxynucleoside kinase [Mycoplasmopsis gallinacea]|uniref:Deoxynucleoside kinase n=1 Tax=Mycoplasmopsis gallinacea TaxID=29556 RepID=A0A6H0V499_9BACT|nr:deoxynucleoside kinase [Mycoplasmopsis gallinacea]QIW62554.1 deoxynucleoside kinase [Mycoplasmopsis gallinacea]